MKHTIFERFRFADRARLVCDGRSLDGAAFNALAERAEARLRGLGLRPGQRVVVYGKKSTDQTALIFAILNAGAVLVPIYQGLTDAQVTHIVSDSDASLIVTTGTPPEGILTVAEHTGTPCIRGEGLIGAADGLPGLPLRANEDAGRQISALIYTSGSTGRPKGICLSRANLALGAKSVAQYMGFSARDTVLCVLPFSFDAGLNQLLAAAAAGASVVLCDFLHAAILASLCNRYRITVITGVPGLWSRLADHDWKDHGGDVRLIANTGGHLHASILADLKRAFPRAGVMPMYGYTEAFRCSFLPPTLVDAKPTSVGRAIPFARFAILTQTGEMCRPGEPGELFQVGPLVSQGYWRRPDLNAEKFPVAPPALHGLAAGIAPSDPADLRCARSGDLMKMDADGDLYFLSRIDEMIKANGFRISPSDIEEAFFRVGVKTAVAVSQSTPKGDLIGVACQTSDLSRSEVGALMQRLKTVLPGYMVPDIVTVFDSLPITANGKFDRASIKSRIFEAEEVGA